MIATARREFGRLLAAVQYFTRVPVPAWVGHDRAGLDAAMRYFPVVGLGVGAFAALLCALAAWALPMRVAVLAGLAGALAVTGALHEDGLADAIDGLGGGYTRAAALRIMKDSRIGSFGACALGLSLLLRLEALASLAPARVALAFVAGHGLSRVGALLVLRTLPYAREEDDSRSHALVAAPGSLAECALAGLALAPAALLGPAGLAATVAVGVASVAWIGVLRRRLGGYTGDCLGAAQQFGEIACYLVLAAWPR